MRKIRNDSAGSGSFAAPRGSRVHTGLDLLYNPKEPVTAEISGTVNRIVLPYANDMSLKGLEIVGHMVICHQLYIVPQQGILGKDVIRGQVIGYAQDIRKRYPHLPSMKNHTHNNFYVNYYALLEYLNRLKAVNPTFREV